MQNQFNDPFAEINADPAYDFEESNQIAEASEALEVPSSLGSRTKPRGQFETIAKRRIRWKSSSKAFESYNFETNENKVVPQNIEFIPLTATVSVTGSRPMGKKGTPSEHYNTISSNEVTNLDTEVMIVREKDPYEDTTNEICRGPYNTVVKEAIKDLPYANYTINIYALVRGSEEIVKFAFSKSSREAGFEINRNMVGKAFKLKEAAENGNGGIVYYTPVIEFVDLTPTEDAKATEIAIEVEEKIKRNKSRVA